MIDYSWVTDDTKTEFEAVLRKHGLKFLRWRSKTLTRKTQPVDIAYKYWWIQKGPTDFRTTNDSIQFKRELLDFVLLTMLPTPSIEEEIAKND